MDPSSKIFRDNLESLMAFKEISAYRLHKITGVSQGYISSILRGEKTPTINAMEKIANGIGMPAWLMLIPNCSVNADTEEMEETAQLLQAMDKNQMNEVRAFLRYQSSKK